MSHSPALSATAAALALALAGCGTTGASSAGLVHSGASNSVVQHQPPAGSCHAIGSGFYSRPDPSCTPGALDPGVTQTTIDRTICVSGWTVTVRPPESVTERDKWARMAAYGDATSYTKR